MIISSPHVAALWGPWQPTQLRGAADKSGGKGLRGNERWEERGFLLFGQDGVCIHVYTCARNQACYNSWTLLSYLVELNQASSQWANVKCAGKSSQLLCSHGSALVNTLSWFFSLPKFASRLKSSTRVEHCKWFTMNHHIYFKTERVCVCLLPVGSLNTALASACVWTMLFRSTAMFGTLFLTSCFSAA